MSSLLKKINFEDQEFLMFVLDELAEKLEYEGKDVIRLTLGKSQEPLHDDIVEAYVDAIRDPAKRNLVYPEGLPALRKKIAEWYTGWGNPTKPENVIINTGTSPLFKDLFRFLLETDDEALLPHPYYSVYNISGMLTPGYIKYYTVDPQTFKLDFDGFKKNFDPERTKIVVLNSPGNPYGNVLSKEDFRKILDIVDGSAYVLSDEIYRNVSFYGKAASILDVVTPKDKVIVSNAFSKGFRMYTTRVGFLILPNELLSPFRVLLQHTLLTTNPSAQYACIEALNHLEEVDHITEVYRQNNEYTVDKLAGVPGVQVLKAEGGFYLVVLCDGFMKKKKLKTSLDLAKDMLVKTGVAVVPGSDFGVPTGLRISFTNLRYKEAIDRLHDYFLA